jgi:hypothetical protein
MSDQVSGRYSAQSPDWLMFGKQNNIAQSDVPAFSNVSRGTTLEDGAAQKTKYFTAVPVFLPEGIEIVKLSAFVGATAQATTSHFWGAVYSGLSPAAIGGEVKPKLLAQSKDNATYEPAATTTLSVELEKPVLTSSENMPHGFLYIGFYVVATTVGSLASFKVATALTKATSALKTYPWFPGAPLPAIQDKVAEGATAPEFLEELTVVGVVPAVLVQ